MVWSGHVSSSNQPSARMMMHWAFCASSRHGLDLLSCLPGRPDGRQRTDMRADMRADCDERRQTRRIRRRRWTLNIKSPRRMRKRRSHREGVDRESASTVEGPWKEQLDRTDPCTDCTVHSKKRICKVSAHNFSSYSVCQPKYGVSAISKSYVGANLVLKRTTRIARKPESC